MAKKNKQAENKKDEVKSVYEFLLENISNSYTAHEVQKKTGVQLEIVISALHTAGDMGKLQVFQEGQDKKYQASEDLKDLLNIINKVEAHKEEKPKLTKEEFEEATKLLTIDDLTDILGLTIKHDNINKLIIFFAMLSAYTEDSQFNINCRAPSSTGKSYIPLELSSLFPNEDIKLLAYSSPTSFFHDIGEWDKATNTIRINLSRVIIIFVDQPHDELLHRLRPLLSHDKKELLYKITDKREKHGLRTKNVIIVGYPSVIFCTGSLRIDEQESTRNIVLSPETTQEKIREALYLKADKESDPYNYRNLIADPKREVLKKRIQLIKEENVKHIIIPEGQQIVERFMKQYTKLKPRHTRDFGRLCSIIKSIALLNIWHRHRDADNNVIANDNDIETGFQLYNEISKSQELGVSPYIYRLYEEVFVPLFTGNPNSIHKKDIIAKHFEIYGRPLPDWLLRQEILPALEAAALVYQEPDPEDRRKMVIYPTAPLTISNQKYIVSEGVGEFGICEGCGARNVSLARVPDPYKDGTYLWLCKDCQKPEIV